MAAPRFTGAVQPIDFGRGVLAGRLQPRPMFSSASDGLQIREDRFDSGTRLQLPGQCLEVATIHYVCSRRPTIKPAKVSTLGRDSLRLILWFVVPQRIPDEMAEEVLAY